MTKVNYLKRTNSAVSHKYYSEIYTGTIVGYINNKYRILSGSWISIVPIEDASIHINEIIKLYLVSKLDELNLENNCKLNIVLAEDETE